MTAPASVGTARRCPNCGAPVSPRAAICAFCDTVLDAEAASRAATAEPAPRRRVTPRRSIATVLRGVAVRFLVIVGALAAVTLAMMGWMGNRVQRYIGRNAQRSAAVFLSDSTRLARGDVRDLETLLATVARDIGGDGVPDSAAAVAIASLNRRGDATDALWKGAPPPPTARPLVGAAARLAAFRALPRPLRPSLRDSLVADTLDPRLADWRRLARSAPLDATWPFSSRLDSLRDPFQLPAPAIAASKELAYRNASAALLAAARGDRRTAALRLQENVAAGAQFTHVPPVFSYLVGRVMMGEASRMLAEVARVSGDSTLAQRSDSLLRLLDRRRRIGMVVPTATALFADPADPRGLALIGDATLPSTVRLDALAGITLGACLSRREVAFGIAGERRTTLATARERLRDVPGADRIVAVHERWLDDLIEHPTRALASMRGRGGMPQRTMFVGGPGARLYLCLRSI